MRSRPHRKARPNSRRKRRDRALREAIANPAAPICTLQDVLDASR